MVRLSSLLLVIAVVLSACASTNQTTTSSRLGPDGQPLPRLYRIGAGAEGAIQLRILDSVNSFRTAAAVSPVKLNAALNAAAATHSRDMSVQNRPWHFGSDGSSPIERARRVGYTGHLVGETISETYETEVQTLAAWMEQEETRRIILSPEASDMGFAYYQESNGKIWWTLVMGGTGPSFVPSERPSAEVTSANRIVAVVAGEALEAN